MNESPQNFHEFDGENTPTIQTSDINALEGADLREQLNYFAGSISRLVLGGKTGKLKNSGRAILISGAWGAGKTTATVSLLKKVCDTVSEGADPVELTIVDASLLPFGNMSESMGAFLNKVATRLWNQGVLDVREEINQVISEVAPENTGGIKLTANLGLLSATREMRRRAASNHTTLHDKFSQLGSKNHVVILVIDDLDRLRPDEIVNVMRMIEKLRKLPYVIVIIPAYKKILTQAFMIETQLSQLSAPTFLRKLIDGELEIANKLPDMREVYRKYFVQANKVGFANAVEVYGMELPDLTWFMLLHNIIIGEANRIWSSADNPSSAVVNTIFSPHTSEYLANMRNIFKESVRPENRNPYFMQGTNDAGADVFMPIGGIYNTIRRLDDPAVAMAELHNITLIDRMELQVTRTEELINEYAETKKPPAFDGVVEGNYGHPLFSELLVPLMEQAPDNNSIVTDNYTMRDIKVLARNIASDKDFHAGRQTFAELYQIVQATYKRFIQSDGLED